MRHSKGFKSVLLHYLLELKLAKNARIMKAQMMKTVAKMKMMMKMQIYTMSKIKA